MDRQAILKECAAMCREMAVRYDNDIEGCDGDELLRFSEGVACSLRLAEIFEKDEMHKWM